MIDWILSNQATLSRVGALAGVTALAGLLAVPWLLVRMPADYFACRGEGLGANAPVARKLLRFGKNLLGAVFLLVGLAMIVLPGPGFLVILVGVSMLSFPGKRELMCKLAGAPAVLKPINHLRRRAGVPPLVIGG